MILVSFFSRAGQNYVNGALRNLSVGNTAVAALVLARLLEAKLFRIVSVVPYPEDYSLCTQVALAELKKGARPSIRDMGPDGADVLFLGYPNWWGTMPMPVLAYLEGHDFSKAIIHLFCTHEGSGLGRSVEDIRPPVQAPPFPKALPCTARTCIWPTGGSRPGWKAWASQSGTRARRREARRIACPVLPPFPPRPPWTAFLPWRASTEHQPLNINHPNINHPNNSHTNNSHTNNSHPNNSHRPGRAIAPCRRQHMQYVTLNNGVEMPILGFGVYQVDDLGVCERCVADAIAVGYRLIDTAAAYQNETAVGKAIRKSGVAREDLFVTTKIWIQDYGQEQTKKAFDRCLERLGLDFLDLCLLHQPFGDYYGAWRALEAILKEGRVRAIGISNFYPDRFIDLASHCEVVPQVNQMEVNPFCQRHQDFAILAERKVQLESWGPFAEGRNNLFTNEVLASIGRTHDRSVAQVVLRWLVQRGVVAIPKSVHRKRLEENFNVFDFSLSKVEMDAIAALDTGRSVFFSHYDPELVNWLSNVRFEGI